MTTIYYPAIFHKEKKSYWVEFPDLEGCFSDGKTLEEAYFKAKEAIGYYLETEDDTYKRKINKPSDISKVIKENKEDIVMLVEFDSLEFSRLYKSKAVKKTLSIPEWLNDLAISNNINFSKLLQDALINKLNIK